MVIDQHPTCVPPDPPSLDLYSGQNLLALFIQLNNNWQGMEKKKPSHHSRVTDRECPEPVSPKLPVVQQQALKDSLQLPF